MSDSEKVASVRAALKNVTVPGGGSLADYSGLSDIIITPSAIAFAISVEPGMEGAFGPVQAAATEAAKSCEPDKKILISITSGRAPSSAAPGAQGGPGANSGPGNQQSAMQTSPVKGIKKIIAVASGKGGVGKSTCSVNLALALQSLGMKVGVLDADLYGPSIPKLLGLDGKPAFRDEKMFKPFEGHGLKAMSIGPMLEPDQAVVWRGPMASSALRQLLRETDWGELDVLVIDLPPGTGDIQISLCQQVELFGAVIVSTPQDLALIDAKKAMDMFVRMKIPLLGLIENMSYFIAPDTGNRYDIFGHGGAKDTASELKIPFLGEIPLHMKIRELSDAGTPILTIEPTGEQAQAFTDIAEKLMDGFEQA
ncbi:MAG: Mrp/NBP35 family ATP-binding protein [Devosiaceae bacterium]|nr:Mrp/NBP35 family ATP-binding protein [Devosiaceae bacterium]